MQTTGVIESWNHYFSPILSLENRCKSSRIWQHKSKYLCIWNFVWSSDITMMSLWHHCDVWKMGIWKCYVFFSDVCCSFLLGVCCFWHHSLTSCLCFQRKVLAKFVDTTCILFHMHSLHFIWHGIDYKQSVLQTRITTLQFITAKAPC